MSIHHLALTFQERGHHVEVVSALPGKRRLLGYKVLEKLTKKSLLDAQDTSNGYRSNRAGYWQISALLEKRLAAWRPDAVIVHGTNAHVLAQASVDHGVPAVIRFISAGSVEALAAAARREPDVAVLINNPLVKFVSVSGFIARHAKEMLDVDSAVIYSPIRLEGSLAKRREPEHITFVSPIPVKGLNIALRVATLLPERRFVFVEGWHSPKTQRKELFRALSKLENVTFRDQSIGLKDVYRSTALLLMPSQIPEGFGRVLVEAAANGIPAVASRLGGIPEALGDSGVLLDASDPPERWAETVDGILSDPVLYSRMSTRALANAQREDFKMSVIATRHLELIKEDIARIF